MSATTLEPIRTDLSWSPNTSRPQNIILIGNPNSGKTTLFNRLTGMRQRVGNFPGVTVEKKVGRLDIPGQTAWVTDLPGCYSLSPHSEDEQVALDSILLHRDNGGPDLIIGVVDAQNLARHLLLILQIVDLGRPLILAINQWDVLLKNGKCIDIARLTERLGIPIVPVSAAHGTGISELRETIRSMLDNPRYPQPIQWPAFITDLTNELAERFHVTADLSTADWRRLIFSHQHARAHEELVRQCDLHSAIRVAHQHIQANGYHPFACETLLLRKTIKQLLDGIMTTPLDSSAASGGITHTIDRVLTHKVYGLATFGILMLVMFFMLFVASEPMVGGLEVIMEHATGMVGGLEGIPEWTRSLLADGLISGVGGVLTFLPQIILLFIMIGLLEDTGYMARAACVMDRWMSRCGLNGKSMVPMLSSFACAIPGIMSARTIEQPRTRLTTILVAPLISCSARLPVYTLLVGAIIVPGYGNIIGGLTLFALHLLGLVLAFPAAWLLNRKLFKTGSTPLMLEMPDYSWPRPRDLFQRVYNSALSFVQRAGTLIVIVSMIVWALAYFPIPYERTPEDNPAFSRMENSYLGKMGHAVQPIFDPAGFDWKISIGILASFPAREVIVATMAVLYQDHGIDDNDESLSAAMRAATWQSGSRMGRPVFALPAAAALLVFIALCMQCSATLVTIARESRWKWALSAYAVYTLVAWIGAVLTYQFLTACGI